MTDHRAGVSIHNLPAVMEGDLDEFIDELTAQERQRQLGGDAGGRGGTGAGDGEPAGS